MWVAFKSDFTFKPKPTVTQVFKAGMVLNVTKACADAAMAAGKAEPVTNGDKPSKKALADSK